MSSLRDLPVVKDSSDCNSYFMTQRLTFGRYYSILCDIMSDGGCILKAYSVHTKCISTSLNGFITA